MDQEKKETLLKLLTQGVPLVIALSMSFESNAMIITSAKPGLDKIFQEAVAFNRKEVNDVPLSTSNHNEENKDITVSTFDRDFNKFDRDFNKFDRDFNKFDRDFNKFDRDFNKFDRDFNKFDRD